jgi:hypothetical protein
MTAPPYYELQWRARIVTHQLFEAFEATPYFQALPLVMVRKVLNKTSNAVTAKNSNVINNLMTQCKEVFPKY